MALKDLFDTVKKEGYITKPLDMYLIQKSVEGNDRAINVNAPSMAGNCLRANYYARMGYPSQESGNIAKTERIFDNGNYVHIRLQKYLSDMGMLLLDEVPLIDDDYKIQGHTDGYLALSDSEVAILEIKSINDNGFNNLKDAKDNHKQQGLIYLHCAYKDRKEFDRSKEERAEYFRSHYQHMKSGSKFTREQKIENEVKLNLISDDILFDTDKPINKVIFLYEDKDNQLLKEFVLERDRSAEEILKPLLSDYEYLNEMCDKEEVPDRPVSNKNDNYCRWCGFKNECWIL